MPDPKNCPAPDDWVSVADACRFLPSCRPGKRMHVSTIHRWIQKGLLERRRRGRWTFVRFGEVMALMSEPERLQPNRELTPARVNKAMARADRAMDRWAKDVLDQAGI